MLPLTRGTISLERMPTECYFAIAGSVLADTIKSYQAGAYRAAIQVLWIAVAADAVGRIEHLAAEGDGKAKSHDSAIRKISEAISTRDPKAFRQAQEFEAEIPTVLLQLDQISWITAEHLERLKRDRNLAAHMSFEWSFDAFELNEDLVRAHIRTVFEALLSQPPVAGRRAADGILAAVREKSFPRNPTVAARILNGIWFDSPKSALLKHLIDQVIFSDDLRLNHTDAALTLASCIRLINKEAFYTHLAAKISKHAPGASDEILSWLFRLLIVDLDAYDAASEAARERIWAFLQSNPPGIIEHAFPKLIDSESHYRLLSPLVEKASPKDLHELNHIYDNPRALAFGISRYTKSKSWVEANAIYEGLLRNNIHHLTIRDLTTVLKAAESGADLAGSHSFKAFLKAAHSALKEQADVVEKAIEKSGFTSIFASE